VVTELQSAVELGGGLAGCLAVLPPLATPAGPQAVASRAASGMAAAGSRSRRPRGTAARDLIMLCS
jgi:hypothetical protein